MMATLFQADDEWTIIRLGKSYSVNFTQDGRRFTGHYINRNNSSTFSGDVINHQDITLVHFVQMTAANGYYATHSGKLITPGLIEGHWYDTAGNSGEFTLGLLGEATRAIANAKQRARGARIVGSSSQNSSPPAQAAKTRIAPLINKAKHYIDRAAYPKAIDALYQALKISADNSRVYSLLGRVFCQQGLYEAAQILTSGAIALNPNDEIAKADKRLPLQQFANDDPNFLQHEISSVNQILEQAVGNPQICGIFSCFLLKIDRIYLAQIVVEHALKLDQSDEIARGNRRFLYQNFPECFRVRRPDSMIPLMGSIAVNPRDYQRIEDRRWQQEKLLNDLDISTLESHPKAIPNPINQPKTVFTASKRQPTFFQKMLNLMGELTRDRS